MSYIADRMEEGLRELQTVEPHDYGAAYRAAFGGGHCLRPATNEAAAEWFHGRCLALELWSRRMTKTLEECGQ